MNSGYAIFRPLAASLLASTLAACSSGGGSSSGEEAVTINTTGTFILEDTSSGGSASLTSDQVAEIILEYTIGSGESVEFTATGTLSDGTEVIFDENDISSIDPTSLELEKTIGTTTYTVTLLDDTAADFFSDATQYEFFTRYSIAIEDSSSTLIQHGYGVAAFGTDAATEFDNLPTGEASYSGSVTGVAMLISSNGGTYNDVDGTFAVDVNFGTGAVTNGALDLDSAIFTDNDVFELADTDLAGATTFEMTISAEDLGNAEATGVLNGSFFGPAAEEIGGNFSISGTTASSGTGGNDDYVAIGAFGAEEVVSP